MSRQTLHLSPHFQGNQQPLLPNPPSSQPPTSIIHDTTTLPEPLSSLLSSCQSDSHSHPLLKNHLSSLLNHLTTPPTTDLYPPSLKYTIAQYLLLNLGVVLYTETTVENDVLNLLDEIFSHLSPSSFRAATDVLLHSSSSPTLLFGTVTSLRIIEKTLFQSSISFAGDDDDATLLILLPLRVASCCHKVKLSLPSWAVRSNYYPRLICRLGTMAIIVGDASGSDTSAEAVGEGSSFFDTVTERLVLSGGNDELVQGLFRLYESLTNDEKRGDNVWVFRWETVTAKDVARYVRSVLRFLSSRNSSSGAGAESFLSWAVSHIVSSNEEIRSAIIDLVILSPSPGEDVTVAKLCLSVLSFSSSQEQQLLSPYLLDVAKVWSQSTFVDRVASSKQNYVTRFLLMGMDDCCTTATAATGVGGSDDAAALGDDIVGELIRGVSVRLASGIEEVRLDGMRVAERLAGILGQSVAFEELDGERGGMSEDAGRESEHDRLDEDEVPDDDHVNNDLMIKKRNARKKRKKNKKVNFPIDPDEEYHSSSSSSSSSSDCSSHSSLSSSSSSLLPYPLSSDDETDLLPTPTPIYLSQCLTLLRSPDTDNDAPLKIRTALSSLPSLLAKHPPDLPDLAVVIVKDVLHLMNPYDLEMFGEMRMTVLIELIVMEPLMVMEYLSKECFGSSVGFGVRMDILDAIGEGVERLAGLDGGGVGRLLGPLPEVRTRGKSAIVKTNTSTATTDSMELKTRRWGHGRHRPSSSSIKQNEFAPLAPAFFYPLTASFITSKQSESLWKSSTSSSHLLLSRVVRTLTKMVRCCGHVHYGVTNALANDLYDLIWGLRVAEKVEVRREVVWGLMTCLEYGVGWEEGCVGGGVVSFLRGCERDDDDEVIRTMVRELKGVLGAVGGIGGSLMLGDLRWG